jgi:HK97 family phage major capsid protein
MKITDTNGQPVWSAPVAGAPGLLLGKPYKETEAMTSTMVFGDFSYLWISDRGQFEVKASSDASDANAGAGSAFLQDEVWYKFKQRHSINVMKGAAFAKMVLSA